MKITNRKDVEVLPDACGEIQELHHSDNLSISYATITGKARSDMHKKMKEVYYIIKGGGKLFIGDKSFDVGAGDIIDIPKSTHHHLEKTSEEPVELMVVTHPRYDTSDIIEE